MPLRRPSLALALLLAVQVDAHAGFTQAQTDAGRAGFTTRWTQSQAFDFGTEGKMLIDTDENRWVVRSLDGLPGPDRERFLQYVYW